MTSSRRAGLLLAICVVLGAPSAAAQTRLPTPQEYETARTLYKEGKALRAQGDLPGAIDKLRAAHALGNTPVTGIELARTYVLVGKLVEAREVCLGIARMPVAADETEKSAEARTEAATLAEKLKPRIATIVVEVTGLARGEPVSLMIDGVVVPDAAVSEEQKVNPGRHDLVARGGEGAAARELRGVVQVDEGQTQRVSLAFPPSAPAAETSAPSTAPAEPNAPQKPERSRLVPIGFATAGVGVVLGSLAGIVAIVTKAQLDSVCTLPNKGCASPNWQSDRRNGLAWAYVSDAGFAIAGVGAVLGIVGLAQGPGARGLQARVSPWIGAGAAGLYGSF